MLHPIVCNCGLPIGDIARIFHKERAEKIAAKTKDITTVNTNPDNLIYMTSTIKGDIDLSDLFEKLGNLPLCCRIQISQAMLIENYY